MGMAMTRLRESRIDVSDARAPKPIGEPLKAHTLSVWSVAFSPESGQPLDGPSKGHLRAARPLRGHGKTLASGGADWRIRLTSIDVDEWLSRACDIAGRNLSQKEWQRYFPDQSYRSTCPQWPAGR